MRALKKNLTSEIKKDEELWFFDESRFGTHSKVGHGWFKTGIRAPVKVKLGYKNFYGAVANPLLQKIFRQFVFQGRSGYRHP